MGCTRRIVKQTGSVGEEQILRKPCLHMQGFNWESHWERWWARLGGQAEALAGLGITAVWLPPPTDSVSPEGYLPRDLYCLDSAYGSAHELRRRATPP